MGEDRPANGEIEIRLQRVSQIFNSLDPSPFYSRDLDNDAEEFIAGWAGELPPNAPLRIHVHLPPEEAAKADQLELPVAVAQYFATRADHHERQLRDTFRIGRRHLVVGLGVLATCLLCSQLARSVISIEPLDRIVEESLIIVGWVANWQPIQLLLYDWWPLKRKVRLYRRLALAKISIVTDATAA